ncbi:MAG: ATPase [Deltaproteobacteria bacterium]|nr:MAG: ATPase [Deltaproteobacteria bacterium]
MAEMSLKERLVAVRDHLLEGLVEREEAVRLGLLATVAGEHLLLIGPPGTAKSLLSRRLHGALAGATYFERLLTRFSVPEELFGPLSIRGLEEDRYVRQTRGYLPEATVAFLDEIFKANSAILNALLTLLNERAFDDDGERRDVPLVSVVGASNELPEGEELDALYDRFLLRLYVGPVSEEGVDALLDLPAGATGEVPDALQLQPQHLEALRQQARQVELSSDLRDLLKDLRRFLAEQGIGFSDRRMRKVVELLRVAAFTDGRDQAGVWDAWLLQHCAWEEPAQRATVSDWWAGRVGTLRATSPARLIEVCAAWEQRLEEARQEQAQQTDAQGRPLYLRPDGELSPDRSLAQPRSDRMGRPLYLAPPMDSYQEPRARRVRPDGSGYTEDELDGLDLYDPAFGGGQFFRAWPGRSEYLADPKNRQMEEHELEPAMGPRQYPRSHIDGWTAQIDEVSEEVRSYLEGLSERLQSLDVVRSHVWVPAHVATKAEETLHQSRDKARGLLERLAALREGFGALPVEG